MRASKVMNAVDVPLDMLEVIQDRPTAPASAFDAPTVARIPEVEALAETIRSPDYGREPRRDRDSLDARVPTDDNLGDHRGGKQPVLDHTDGRGEPGGKRFGIVEFAEVQQFLDTPVKRYSSGMYMRLAFAVAAHLEPEVLLIDEVLAVGDAAFQEKCLGKMEQVASEGRTVFLVSHNLQAISTLTRRTIASRPSTLDRIGTSIRSGPGVCA